MHNLQLKIQTVNLGKKLTEFEQRVLRMSKWLQLVTMFVFKRNGFSGSNEYQKKFK